MAKGTGFVNFKDMLSANRGISNKGGGGTGPMGSVRQGMTTGSGALYDAKNNMMGTIGQNAWDALPDYYDKTYAGEDTREEKGSLSRILGSSAVSKPEGADYNQWMGKSDDKQHDINPNIDFSKDLSDQFSAKGIYGDTGRTTGENTLDNAIYRPELLDSASQTNLKKQYDAMQKLQGMWG